jgi:flagellar hook-basal body complex protein FliE
MSDMKIPSIGLTSPTNTASIQSGITTGAANNVTGLDFKQTLESLSDMQNTSDNLISQLAAGENVDIHQVMIANEQTDISFRVAMAIRDQLVNTYREVMRMAV